MLISLQKRVFPPLLVYEQRDMFDFSLSPGASGSGCTQTLGLVMKIPSLGYNVSIVLRDLCSQNNNRCKQMEHLIPGTGTFNRTFNLLFYLTFLGKPNSCHWVFKSAP
jgi:hypothetical protein